MVGTYTTAMIIQANAQFPKASSDRKEAIKLRASCAAIVKTLQNANPPVNKDEVLLPEIISRLDAIAAFKA